MDFNSKLEKFAELIVRTGVNLQSGEELVVSSPIECADFARRLAEEAYKAGAKKVSVIYNDQKLSRINFENASVEVLTSVPEWAIMQREAIVDNKACYIAIASEDPAAYSGLDAKKISDVSRATHTAYKKFYDASMTNGIKWCVMSVPNAAWAKKVFPDLSEKQAILKLWDYIFKTMRLDKKDPVKAWATHQKKLEKRCRFLNRMQFDAFRYHNSIGTDVTVKMNKNYVFSGGAELSKDGCLFSANMPTEEVFSAPAMDGVNGRLVSALPLCENGEIIRNFTLTFENGHITDFSAEEGYETLKGIIETDEGSHRLGEIAMVGYDNPIRKLGVLFYNTLFDENASCHFAIGQAYASVKGADKMTEEEQLAVGLNQSATHVDFMVGTKDLSIVGIKNGVETPIFVNGDWAI